LGYALFVVAAWLVVAALAILLRVFVFRIPRGSSRELGYWAGVFLAGVLAIATVDRFVEGRFRKLCRLSDEGDSA
jgi:Na+-transporting NADH:ubiquinone oxidoreductase subunit NqrB